MWNKAIEVLDDHKYSLDEQGKTWENIIRDQYKTYPGGENKTCQQLDCNILTMRILSNPNWFYESEKRVYISDYNQVRHSYTSKGRPHKTDVYFDHVLYYKGYPLIIESDEWSHYSKDFYKTLYKKKHKIDISDGDASKLLQDTQKRDAVKNIWAAKRGFPLIRLMDYWSIEYKKEYIYKIITQFEQEIDSYEKKTTTNSY